jgi:uncharacterized paraquat-inducible protein A
MSNDRLDLAQLTEAHKHSKDHRTAIEASAAWGCFYCRKSGAVSEIENWVDDGETALCPRCGIDSVIGSASGLPVTNGLFLGAMKRRWF